MNKYRMQSSEIFPLSNTLFEDEAQSIILNKFFPETKLKNAKHKNSCTFRLIVSETVKLFSVTTIARILGKCFFLLKMKIAVLSNC